MPAVRPAVVSGLFYPAEPDALREEIAQRLAELGEAAAGGALAPKLLIVPHAGYTYCAPVAAQAYALLQPWRGRIHRVVLLGPAHRIAMRGLAAPAVQAFETPLGEVPIDRAALEELEGLPQFMRDDRPHEREHSIEVQLPFLQHVLGEFSLVPLVVGEARPDEVAQVLERLWGGDETLILISSDLSHYLTHGQAQTLDEATAQRILALDASLHPHQACGSNAINGALQAARQHGLAPRLLA